MTELNRSITDGRRRGIAFAAAVVQTVAPLLAPPEQHALISLRSINTAELEALSGLGRVRASAPADLAGLAKFVMPADHVVLAIRPRQPVVLPIVDVHR